MANDQKKKATNSQEQDEKSAEMIQCYIRGILARQ